MITNLLGYQMLRMFRRDSEYVGSHATEHRAPEGVVCEVCEKPEKLFGNEEERVVLAQCSMCETWFCTPDYTMHTFTPPSDEPKVSWWKRAIRRG